MNRYQWAGDYERPHRWLPGQKFRLQERWHAIRAQPWCPLNAVLDEYIDGKWYFNGLKGTVPASDKSGYKDHLTLEDIGKYYSPVE